jgi:hypothetical protein
MNSFGQLTWTFTPLVKCADFLDLTLSITASGIKTYIFEKK